MSHFAVDAFMCNFFLLKHQPKNIASLKKWKMTWPFHFTNSSRRLVSCWTSVRKDFIWLSLIPLIPLNSNGNVWIRNVKQIPETCFDVWRISSFFIVNESFLQNYLLNYSLQNSRLYILLANCKSFVYQYQSQILHHTLFPIVEKQQQPPTFVFK